MNKCKICNIEIDKRSKMCRSCAHLKDGRTLRKHYCIDCGKLLRDYTAKRCQKHFHLWLGKNQIGKNNPFFGKQHTEETKQKMRITKGNNRRHCLQCDKELYNYKSKYCWDCYIGLGLNQGINANNFINGFGNKPYNLEFSKQLKESIRDRDNHECQLCHKTEVLLHRKLDVHHINYNKEDCREENLTSLCLECHRKTNGNRDYWFAYFTAYMTHLIST